MARLIFSGEKFGGRIYELAVEMTTVGRGDHNTLTIHDPSVSNTHCEILVYGDEVIVRDLGSSNGTFVNGVRLHDQQRPLKHGQVVKFGDVGARLELDEPAAMDTTTDVTAVHWHARYLREQQQPKPEPPASAAAKLDASPGSPLADHTVVWPQPPEAVPAVPPAAVNRSSGHDRPATRVPRAVIAAVLVLGLAVVLWLLFASR